ncbi:MAG: hypothetical protein GX021_01615 [Tissierellia bacterium]|nr:hypothetical protein [Tissierellia bacterium]
MLNYILFIIGFALIGFSIIVISNDLKKSALKIDEISKIEENVKEYYKLTEEIIGTFDHVIGSKIEEINAININLDNNTNKDSVENTIINSKYENIKTSFEDNTVEKILELHSIGLNIEEIAKKLNKGVREIEIIMKMNSSKNMDKNI